MTTELMFFIHLVTPEGVDDCHVPVYFSSFEAAYLDVVSTIPGVASDVLRRGLDPMGCSFLICDEHNRLLETVHFQELVKTSSNVQMTYAQDVTRSEFGNILREKSRETRAASYLLRIETRNTVRKSRAQEQVARPQGSSHDMGSA